MIIFDNDDNFLGFDMIIFAKDINEHCFEQTFNSSNFLRRERGVESESGQWRGESDKYF